MAASAPLNAHTAGSARSSATDDITIDDIEIIDESSSDTGSATPIKSGGVDLGLAADPAMPIIYIGALTFLMMIIGWAILVLV